ncbi:exportin-2-like [Tropilaelaps mercedesae]|uniref:Exportin-2 n=1 Tax=Tropilaelaps mercedesae TaxID=418985 RepID=A0A1V9Y3M3_9ACAR|nr:exportin-2-like [Tropilaelaps mercedesae]
MELTDANMATMANYLKQTLDPVVSQRKTAETFLESVEANKNYPILLLSVVDKAEFEDVARLAGAITFKNYVKRNWTVPDDTLRQSHIHTEDRERVKQLIVSLMLKSPANIQRQLSDAVSIIGKSDFPDNWPKLLNEMIAYFATGDFHVINGVLQTANSLFQRYRYEFKSQKLWQEIKYVLDTFAKPLTDLFVATMELASSHGDNPAALQVIFNSLVLIAEIFYSLNYQDIPEIFEDNMKIWFERFHTLLAANNTMLASSSEDEPGVLEKLKSQICDNVSLYAEKYDEEFAPLLPNFIKAVWALLTSTGSQLKYDTLVSNALRFLSIVANKPQYKVLFEDPAIFGSLCEKIIMPNMEFRQADEELFEDNPEEYVRRDIEGSDVDTRRRAACDLVRSLSRHFEDEITESFSAYISVILQQYNSDNKNFWKNKDIAIYLVTSMAVKASTAKHGTTQTSHLVNIPDYFVNCILPELTNVDPTHLLVIKADCIKFHMVFRNQLPKELHIQALPLLVQHLTNPNFIVHTYAAAAVEKLFTMRVPGTDATLISPQDVQPVLETLLKNLFAAMDQPCSAENEYIMKSIMRTFSLSRELIIPYLGTLLPALTNKLMAVSKNPSKPHFNHYLFETLCLSVKLVCKKDKAAVSNFETMFFPVFQELLAQDVQEFVPYVFQLLSMMLEFHSGSAPEAYMGMFPCLLMPILWERQGNIQPLVRLIQAFIERSSAQIVAMDKLNAVLGVFQKLIASKNNDHQGFYIVQSLVEHMEPAHLQPFIKQIFILLFQRLTSSKTTKLVKGLIVFFNLFVVKYGPVALQTTIDELQPQLFGMVLEKLYVPETQRVTGHIERKICAVGMIKILCELPVMVSTYEMFWPQLLEALIRLLEAPEDTTIPDNEHFIEVEDVTGYQAAYSQLQFANKQAEDPLKHIQEPRLLLVEGLSALSRSAGQGKLPSLIQNGLTPNANQFVQQYLQSAGVTLS